MQENAHNDFPQTFHDAVKYFAEPQRAHDFMMSLRWPDGVHCPRCDSDKVGFIATRKVWECKCCKTKKQFTIKVGTLMEDSPIALEKWLCAIWLMCNSKNGVSSYEIHRHLGVTQKSAWFMMHRIRLALHTGSFKMSGDVESDETFVGGRDRFRHPAKKKRVSGWKGKTPVQGLLERGEGDKASRVKLTVLKTTRNHEVQGNVYEYVLKGSNVYTDALRSYIGLSKSYSHESIDHAECYAKGKVHTNGLENFWSLLKRSIKGTYISIEPTHLFRYLDEQAFRYNERKESDSGRFLKAMRGTIGKSLSYVDLTGKGKKAMLPA